MRLFTGIPIPDQLMDNFTRLLDYLRPTGHLSWSQSYNLHITTKFIGEWPANRLDELKAALAPVSARPPFSLGVRKVGWFPNPHSPRVLWTGIQTDGALIKLANDIDESLEPLGIAREKRTYSPHLTLARVKNPAVPLQHVREAIANLRSDDFGQFITDRFVLYLSKPGPNGSIYTQLAEFHFTGE